MASSNIIVRGGTSSAANDQRLAQEKAAGVARRAYHDHVKATVRARPQEASLYTRSLGGVESHACAVLTVLNKDKSVLDYVIADVTFEEHSDASTAAADECQKLIGQLRKPRDPATIVSLKERLTEAKDALERAKQSGAVLPILIMVCPSCLHRRNLSVAQSHITIRSWHRRFTLDTKRQGELWVSPRPPHQAYTLAGTINTHETITCPTCAFKFQIDDGVIREV